jgi:hypothetical protein
MDKEYDVGCSRTLWRGDQGNASLFCLPLRRSPVYIGRWAVISLILYHLNTVIPTQAPSNRSFLTLLQCDT